MKKIPTVFIREFENHKIKRITPEFTSEEAKEAFLHGEATVKIDGACCAIMGGIFYKRFDAKPWRMIPAGSMPCDAPDEEGLVFWYKGEPVCKIKRSDFGLKWPEEEKK